MRAFPYQITITGDSWNKLLLKALAFFRSESKETENCSIFLAAGLKMAKPYPVPMQAKGRPQGVPHPHSKAIDNPAHFIYTLEVSLQDRSSLLRGPFHVSGCSLFRESVSVLEIISDVLYVCENWLLSTLSVFSPNSQCHLQ